MASKIVPFFETSSSSSSSSSSDFLNFFLSLSKTDSFGSLNFESFLNSGIAFSSSESAESSVLSDSSERTPISVKPSSASAKGAAFLTGFFLRFLKPPLLSLSAIIPVPRYSITTSIAPVISAMRILAIANGE